MPDPAEVIKRTELGPPKPKTKYSEILALILGMGPDDVLKIPRGHKIWRKKDGQGKVRNRLGSALGYHCKKLGISLLVERYDADTIIISRAEE